MSHRVLVAGIGNIFLGDDGFGVEVAQRLAKQRLPAQVRVVDYGIRGMHLAYEMLDGGYATTILVDAMPRGGSPGTVYLLEPNLEGIEQQNLGPTDAHGMDPRAVFALLRSLGGSPGRVLIVGCEPVSTEEEMGLSAPVAQAVDEAVRLVLEVVDKELESDSETPLAQSEGGPET